MKSRRLLLTTLAACFAAATISAGSAFSAQASAPTPTYPSDFVRTLDLSDGGLTDYAVSGDKCALASKTTIYILTAQEGNDGCILENTNIGTQVTALDYADGKLYYEIASGDAFIYPALPGSAPTRHDFPQQTRSVTLGNNQYTLDNESKLELFNLESGAKTPIAGEFSSLKQFDGSAYAVMDDVPYKIDGQTASPLNMEYAEFSAAKRISTGTIPEKLKTSNYEVKTATLKEGVDASGKGRYYTRVNADSMGDYFEVVGENHTRKCSTKACLVLAEEGNLSVIVIEGNCYITATDNLEPLAYNEPVNDWAQGADGTRKAYIRERTGVYSAPYMCESTLIAQVEADSAVTVNVREKFALEFLGSLSVFYRVEYKDGANKTVSGFVPAGFLDKYDYSADDNKPASSGSDGFKYDTNVTTVVLVLVVVALVIIAIAYLTIVGTKPDKKKTKKKKDEEEQE